MTNAPARQVVDGGHVFDLGHGKLRIGFVFRSVNRRRKTRAAVFFAANAVAMLSALAAPKTFFAGTTMIARNDSAIRQITLLDQAEGTIPPTHRPTLRNR